jgi:thiol-disulfide isomerase/thioredoxin
VKRSNALAAWSIAMLAATGVVVTLPGCGPGTASTLTGKSTTTTEAPPAAVTLEVVNKKGYEAALKAKKGKVVVVDVWADWCIPCKEEFPHLVELHKRYAGDGLACVSVSLDDADKKATPLAFLQRKGAAFANYLLDEPTTEWQKLFDINGPPAVFVYDRDGKLAQRFDHNDVDKTFTYADVEKLVQKLLTPAH